MHITLETASLKTLLFCLRRRQVFGSEGLVATITMDAIAARIREQVLRDSYRAPTRPLQR